MKLPAEELETRGRDRAYDWKSLLVTATIAVALGAATWLLAPALLPARLPEGFPAPPDLGKAGPGLRKALAGFEKEARRHPGSAEAVGNLAIAYHANDYFAPAEQAYRIAARLAPRDYRWLYFQAMLKEETGNEQEQFELLEQTVRLQPECAPALLKLADGAFKHDRLDDAAHAYELAGQSAGKEAYLQAAFGLARVAARREDWNQVVARLAPLPQAFPNVRPPYQLLQKAYQALGQTAKAAEMAEALLSGRFTDVPPVSDPLNDRLIEVSYSSTRLLKQAGLLSRFGSPDRAIQVARRAAEANPSDADIRNFIANTQLTFYADSPQAMEDAVTQLGECLRLKPDDLMPLWSFSKVFFEKPKAPATVERLRALLRQHSQGGEGHYCLGLAADAQGDSAAALSEYQAALKINPDNGAASNKLGVLMEKDGKLEQALAYFQKSVQLDPRNAVARMNLGVALLQREDYVRGMHEVDEVLRLTPHDPAAHFCMGFALLYTRRADEAVAHFREGLRYRPGDAEAHYGLASALSTQGKRADAAAEATEALRLQPGYRDARQLLLQLQH